MSRKSFDDMDFDSIALPLGEGRPGASAGDDRPENPPQAIEKTDSAPGNPEALLPLSPRSPGQEPGEGEGWPPDLIHGEGPGRLAAGDDRPENRAQSAEKIESAPETRSPREPRVTGPGRERAGRRT